MDMQVSFHDVAHSDTLEAYAREHGAKLERIAERAVGCRVTIEAPHRHQHLGKHFRVSVDLAMPGGHVVASHAGDIDTGNEDAYAAIDQAFDRAKRRLEEYVRRQKGELRERESPQRDGRITKLWTYEGYGFLETDDGLEVYFHRNSVLAHGFEQLKIGSKVRFVEELGDKGPQASTVTLV